MKRFAAFLIIAAVLGAAGFLILGFLGKGQTFDGVGNLSDGYSASEPMASPPSPSPGVKMASRSMPESTSSFDDAKIAFQTPSTMQLGKSREVTLLLNLKKSIEELKAELGREFPTSSATINASPIMEASLSGGAFDIKAANPTRQAVSAENNTTWEWSVRPLEKGNHTLKLRLYAIVNIQGTSAPLQVKTFERDIPVGVSVPEMMLSYAKNNIQLVWLVLVVPIAGLLSRLFGRKRTAE